MSNIYHADRISNYLVNEIGLSGDIIDCTTAEIVLLPRYRFLADIANLVNSNNLQGDVAEGGVFRGTFAQKINEIFPERTLWLFDSFDSFNADELMEDRKEGLIQKEYNDAFLKLTSVDDVKSVLPHPNKAIFVQGYFPHSIKNEERLLNTQFIFVNLDFDLYQPTLSGLAFFYPRLVTSGVILIHDYFAWSCRGAAEAVNEFCKKNKIAFLPIGDGLSVAITKQ